MFNSRGYFENPDLSCEEKERKPRPDQNNLPAAKQSHRFRQWPRSRNPRLDLSLVTFLANKIILIEVKFLWLHHNLTLLMFLTSCFHARHEKKYD